MHVDNGKLARGLRDNKKCEIKITKCKKKPPNSMTKCGNKYKKDRKEKKLCQSSRALVLILPVEFHCRYVVRICSQVLLVI